MRILYIVHQFFPEGYTGTERFVLNTAKQMQRMGHYAEVLTYGYAGDRGFTVKEGVKCKNYNFQNVPVIALRHLNIPTDLSFVFDIFDEEIEPILKKIITRERYDIIHVAHPLRLGSTIKVASSKGLPIVLTLTDFWMMCPRGIAVTSKGVPCRNSEKNLKCVRECFGESLKNEIIFRSSEMDAVIKNVNYMVAGTNFLKQVFLENNPNLKIDVIRFGEDYAHVKPNMRTYSKESKITAGFLSTLQPHKGAHVLLEGFRKANVKNLDVKIYGHYFSEIDYYNNLISEYKSESIEFCGEYKYEDMSRIFGDLDLLVVPSIWWENSPLVLLSALAHNVPAIVSNLGGLTEIVREGENGFIFEANDPQSLADLLKKICSDPTILNEMKRTLSHPPRIEEQAFEYEKIYTKLLNVKNSVGGSNRE